MKTLVRVGLVIMSPYLLYIYWRNTARIMNDIHADYQLTYE